jgi:RNA polymerase primary sigma factor
MKPFWRKLIEKKGVKPMKQRKFRGKNGDKSSVGSLPSSAISFKPSVAVPPTEPTVLPRPYDEVFSLDFGTHDPERYRRREEIGRPPAESGTEEEVVFNRQHITWAYLKGIDKVPLLTPEKETRLAKKIKDGERELKILEAKAKRLRGQLSASRTSGNPEKESTEKGARSFTSSPPDMKERELTYHEILRQRQQTLLETDKAQKELVEANLRLVVSIVKRYMNRGISFLDLVQEGNLGLMQAMFKFDYTRGYRFSTYASWWVRASILRAFAEKSRTIRIPSYLFEIKGKLMKCFSHLVKTSGREPTPQEISDASGISTEEVERIFNLVEEPVSLHTAIGEEDSTLEDLIPDETIPCPSEHLLEKDLTEQIQKLLAGLSPREERIVRLRFGIGQDGECTLEEIGKQFGLSRERIRQIEAHALQRLRDPARSKDVKEYFE